MEPAVNIMGKAFYLQTGAVKNEKNLKHLKITLLNILLMTLRNDIK